jgi:hypothetical protein
MRFLAVGVAILLVILHLWVGLSNLFDGIWMLAVRLGFLRPIPYSQVSYMWIERAVESGLVLGSVAVGIGALRLVGAAALVAGLIGWLGWGRRGAMIAGAAVAWLTHATHGVVAGMLGFWWWRMDDMMFSAGWYEAGWELSSWVWLRYPLNVMGSAAVLAVTAVGTVLILVGSRPATVTSSPAV